MDFVGPGVVSGPPVYVECPRRVYEPAAVRDVLVVAGSRTGTPVPSLKPYETPPEWDDREPDRTRVRNHCHGDVRGGGGANKSVPRSYPWCLTGLDAGAPVT